MWDHCSTDAYEARSFYWLILSQNRLGIRVTVQQLEKFNPLIIFYSRDVYEEIIATFPTNGKFWKAYIEHEMKMGNHERVEKLFQRSLIKVNK